MITAASFRSRHDVGGLPTRLCHSDEIASSARFLAVCVIAYLVAAFGQALFLEILLRGELQPDSPRSVLALATLGTVISGMLGGFVAAGLGRSRPMLHVLGLLSLLMLDTISVLADDPGHLLLFTLGGALTIQVAAWVGGWFRVSRPTGRMVTTA